MSSAAFPADGVVLRQPDGLGVATKAPLDPFGSGVGGGIDTLQGVANGFPRSATTWVLSTTGARWLTGVIRRTNLDGKPPQVYVTATETGLGVIPTSNWMMRKGRGPAEAIWLRYPEIATIELRPATAARMPVMVPTSVWQLGQIIVTATSGQTGTLSGTTVTELSAFLVYGAKVEP